MLYTTEESAASYRADEWDVNKWVWEGILKVISKGEECIIRLEDKNTSELYARAFLRKGEPHPVEPVIDSSRYFVLRAEENIDGRLRHAFIGIGFRERTEAYDFQAALHDHMKYLDKKKTAEEMEQKFQQTSLKSAEIVKSKVSENNSPEKKANQKEPLICIKPPPPPPGPLSTVYWSEVSHKLSPKSQSSGDSNHKASESTEDDSKESISSGNEITQDIPDDDFGDFQTAS
ncbi:Adaptin ear-binding coat-associated protein 1 NECAP-1 [Prunus dulcis]|uniref:Adaptin ear-binding coat-associated protein 1 NECAP-1 n=1 Tax=Prunus dulcis TaxID=3755 RepID=A0A4Y1QY46_PRUDU|nr:Adaptin ear-binding coat-associated protein 1 NECAP-1 [Prunus dulcis]